MISLCHSGWIQRCLVGALPLAGLLLTGCDGGGGDSQSAGVGGTGIVYGKATDFGSIYVNGQRFETNRSEFIVDGNSNATQDDLSLGMVVLLEVELENGLLGENAIRVVYDDELEGPITAIATNGSERALTIFGQTVVVDQTSTVFDGTGFGALGVNDVVEISGFRTSATEISATFVEFKGRLNPGVTEVELRGTIQNLAGTPPNQSFEVDGVTVNTHALTEIDVPGDMLTDGTYVEVEGVIQVDQSVLADEVEAEDENFGSNLPDVSLQGLISQYNSIADFEIDGQQVDASLAILQPAGAASQLGNGLEVEVEGEIINGILIADELEVREGESELHSFVSSVDPANNRFEVNFAPLAGSVVINTDSQTLFEDDGPLELPNFSLDQLNIGDFVLIGGREIAGEVTANTVKRDDSDNSKLAGAVDGFGFETSITILGITYLVDADTEYEGFASASAFFGQLAIGDLIEIEDEQIADGIADEVEEGDDD